jgi:hypothetical protein
MSENLPVEYSPAKASEPRQTGSVSIVQFDPSAVAELTEYSNPEFDAEIEEMAERFDRGEELTGEDLAPLYGFALNEDDELEYYPAVELYLKVNNETAGRLSGERQAQDPLHRYKDHQKIHEAIGDAASINQQIQLMSDARLQEYGDFRYDAYMSRILGMDDVEGTSSSFDDFYHDTSIDTELVLAPMWPAMKLGYAADLKQRRDYTLDLDQLAQGITPAERRNILSGLEIITQSNPDLSLGDLSKVLGMPIRDILNESETARKIFGGTIIDINEQAELTVGS